MEETKQSSVFTQVSEVTEMEDFDQHKHTDYKAQNRNILHTAIPKYSSGNTKKEIRKTDFFIFITCSQISTLGICILSTR